MVSPLGGPAPGNLVNALDALRLAEREIRAVIRARKHPKLDRALECHSFLRQAIDCLLRTFPPTRR